jgi:hypothetical protein
VNYSVGNGPRGVAVGDLNRDGKLDLVVTNTTDKNLIVLLGNGDGSFATPVPYSLGDLGPTSPVVAMVADFNSDSKLDVAVLTTFTSNTGGNVLVLSGNGDGTLQAPVTYPTGVHPLWMVGHDINNDGKPDLLIGSSTTAVILAGNGDGSFRAPLILPSSLPSQGVDAADLNGDGYPDVITGNNDNGGTVSVYMATAPGSFKAPVIYPLNLGASQGCTVAVAADVNGDGKPDVLCSILKSNGFVVLRNQGDGTLQVESGQSTYIFAAGTSPSDMVVADLNGDGKLDVAAADFNTPPLGVPSDNMGVSAIAGSGDGIFPSDGLQQFEPNVQSAQIESGDFNGDGVPDLVTANTPSNDISVLLNQSSVVTLPPPTPQITSLSPFAAKQNSGAFTLTVNGSGFVSSSVVEWNGTPRPTTFVDASHLTAAITAADLASSGTASVTASNSTSDGLNSAAAIFAIDTATQTTVKLASATATVIAGQSATVTVQPSGFSSAITVNCLNAPAGVTCSYSSSTNSVTVQTSTRTPPGSYTLTLVFTATTLARLLQGFSWTAWLGLLGLPLALVVTGGGKRRQKVAMLLTLLLTVIAIACGGGSGSSSSQSPPPQSQAAQASTTLVLNVQ